jgi:malate synthase
MTNRLKRGNLQVSEILVNFIEKEALPDTNISADEFWSKLELILDKFVPENKSFLRSELK